MARAWRSPSSTHQAIPLLPEEGVVASATGGGAVLHKDRNLRDLPRAHRLPKKIQCVAGFAGMRTVSHLPRPSLRSATPSAGRRGIGRARRPPHWAQVLAGARLARAIGSAPPATTNSWATVERGVKGNEASPAVMVEAAKSIVSGGPGMVGASFPSVSAR